MSLRSYIHSTFDPRRIPGLESWWDAADAASVTLDEGRVSQLADKSGKGRHAANTTSGSTQPTYVTGARNGLNVARFAAASVQRLTVASSTAAYNFLHDGTASCVFAVNTYGTSSDPNALHTLFSNCSIPSTDKGAHVIYDDRSSFSANNACRAEIFGANASPVANTLNAANSAYLESYNNILTPNQVLVQEYSFSANATASQRITAKINGGSSIDGNNKTQAAASGNANSDMYLGVNASSLGAPLTGDICEILIFSQIPTAAARDLIRRYLGAKWGVTVG
jgi:hypothetical protein